MEVFAGERAGVDGRSIGHLARLYVYWGLVDGLAVCDVFGGYHGVSGEEEVGAVEELACVFSAVVSFDVLLSGGFAHGCLIFIFFCLSYCFIYPMLYR